CWRISRIVLGIDSEEPRRSAKATSRCWCALGIACALTSRVFAYPFYLGGDVSLLPTIEQLNAGNNGPGIGGASLNPFKDGGVLQANGKYNGGGTRPAEQILVN